MTVSVCSFLHHGFSHANTVALLRKAICISLVCLRVKFSWLFGLGSWSSTLCLTDCGVGCWIGQLVLCGIASNSCRLWHLSKWFSSEDGIFSPLSAVWLQCCMLVCVLGGGIFQFCLFRIYSALWITMNNNMPRKFDLLWTGQFWETASSLQHFKNMFFFLSLTFLEFSFCTHALRSQYSFQHMRGELNNNTNGFNTIYFAVFST